MADWYVSSVAWAALPKFSVGGTYSVGQIVQPLTAPAFNAQYAFQVSAITTGIAGTEPSWPATNNATVTTTGVTFKNVSGQSANGWSAPAGNLYCITTNGSGGARAVAGDRIFLSSDHSESSTSTAYALTTAVGYGVVEVISVNRGGSVPPQSADYLSGAAITFNTSGNWILDTYTSVYWQGITLTLGGTAGQLVLSSSGCKSHYFRNCAIVLSTSTATAYINVNFPCVVTFDNTTVQFSAAGQRFNLAGGGYTADFRWINTPSALLGTAPTTLFTGVAGSGSVLVSCRGVDLSAATGTLYYGGNNPPFGKMLLDSCKIASGIVRLGTTAYVNTSDEIELVNCYDGTHFLAERHTPAGDLTTEFSTTLVGGATDNVGLFSHKMVSSVRSDDFAMPLEGFWLDVNNTLTGGSHTATVEIIGSASLTNADIWLVLEYQGTVSSSLASFVTSQPTNALATPAAVPSSTATWNSPPATPVTQHLQVTFTPQVAGRVRGQVRLGKPSTTVWVNPQIAIT